MLKGKKHTCFYFERVETGNIRHLSADFSRVDLCWLTDART